MEVLAILVALALAAGIGLAVWRAKRRPQAPAALPPPEPGEYQLYNQLLKRAGVNLDAERANRLIDYERRRDPSLTRKRAIEEALRRLGRDRG